MCKPTKERQTAAVEMAQQADVVIVVGGATSNNTRELVKTCAEYCARVYHVQTDADLRSEWLLDADVIGLTAGTSTPDEVIDRVEARLRQMSEGCGPPGQRSAARRFELRSHRAIQSARIPVQGISEYMQDQDEHRDVRAAQHTLTRTALRQPHRRNQPAESGDGREGIRRQAEREQQPVARAAPAVPSPA